MTIYVGNLSYKASENELNKLFSSFGEVKSVKIMTDKFTGKSKGFAFIEMADGSSGAKAIESLHQTDFKERKMIVNEARPREERPRNNSHE
jgi:RNA recognition motif-containing protein